MNDLVDVDSSGDKAELIGAIVPNASPSDEASTVSALSEPGATNRNPKKKVNSTIREQFSIEPTVKDGKPHITQTCNHCGQSKVLEKFNATKATGHILSQCRGASNDADVKKAVRESTQANKKARTEQGILSRAWNGSDSIETLVDLHNARKAAGSRKPVKNLKQTSLLTQGFVLSPETASDIIRREVEVVLSRFEPLSRLLDPLFHSTIVARVGSGILKFIPSCTYEIFDKYVCPIDRAVYGQIKDNLIRRAENMTLAVDGVTMLSKSYLLYTVSKGEATLFMKSTQLGSLVHATDAEVNDCVAQMERCRKDFDSPVTILAVDKAANDLMVQAKAKYEAKHPDEPPIIKTRDLQYCLDLLAKDSQSIAFFKQLSDDCDELCNLLSNERVSSILEAEQHAGRLVGVPEIISCADTPFNETSDYYEAMLAQKPFLDVIRELPAFDECVTSGGDRALKETMSKTLDIVTHKFYQRLKVGTVWFGAIKDASKVVAGNDVPTSAYLPVVQALRNELNNALRTPGYANVDEVLGHGAVAELATFLRPRFNMDGNDPAGAHVGLLDQNQIWAHMVDPHRNVLSPAVVIENGLAEQFNKMIDTFVPIRTSDSNEQKTEKKALQSKIRSEFCEYKTQKGPWLEVFRNRYVESNKNREELLEDQKALTLKGVSAWVSSTGGHEGRLGFFALAEATAFQIRVATPLLSMRSTGSITVERVAKPMTNKVLEKHRNELACERSEMLLRAGLNLRFLLESRGLTREEIEIGISSLDMDYDYE